MTPARSTTYTLVATGPGGRAEASTRITVNIPPPPPPPPAPAGPSIEELFAQQMRDAFFDFDKYDIRPDARVALTQSAEFLRRYAGVRVLIEGHCDERGTNEYNIGLGDARTQAARQFLISLGVSADRIQTVSYGEERPFCTESNEECWQLNRRAHFVLVR
ncbi:MAG: peptidoglycan-associated lipoprotein Pal [Terriglobia bacterium]